MSSRQPGGLFRGPRLRSPHAGGTCPGGCGRRRHPLSGHCPSSATRSTMAWPCWPCSSGTCLSDGLAGPRLKHYLAGMQQYLDLMRRVRTQGVRKTDRTGTGTLSVFGHQMRFDLNAGFPLVTTKKVHVKSIVHELIWFIAGDTNTAYIEKHGVSFWDERADSEDVRGRTL